MREIERAQQLDPLSPIINLIRSGILGSLRRDDAAGAQLKNLLAAHPEFAAARGWAGAQYIERKMYPEAEAELRAFGKLNGQNGDAKALLARGVADPTQRIAAVTSLETSPDNADMRKDAILYAFYLASLGERNRALDELEIFAVKHNSGFVNFALESDFRSLARRSALQGGSCQTGPPLYTARRHDAMSESRLFSPNSSGAMFTRSRSLTRSRPGC